MMTETKTIYTSGIFDNYKVPYLLMDFPVKDGKKNASRYVGRVKGWKKMTYAQTKKHNQHLTGANSFQTIDVNLNKSPFVVVDIDIKEKWKATWKECAEVTAEIQKVKDVIGDYSFETASVGSGAPHYWFFKKKDDKNTTKCNRKNIGGLDLTTLQYISVDLLYQNVFEKRTGTIDSMIDDEYKCSFNHFPIKKEIKKPTKKDEKLAVTFKSCVDFKQKHEMDDEAQAILDNIDPKMFDDFKTWHQFISACFNHFGGFIEAIEYSKKNDKYQSAEEVMKYVNQNSKASFGTICWLSIQSNKDNHFLIRKRFSDSMDFTDRGLARVFLEINKGEFTAQQENIYVLDKTTKFWRVDKTKALLYVTVQDSLHKKYNRMKNKYANIFEDLNTNKPNFENELDESLYQAEQIKVKEILENLCNLVKKIDTYTDCSSLVKQVRLFLSAESFDEIPFDTVQPYYFAFKNVCFSLHTFEKVEVKPTDYIIKNTRYEWREATDEELIYVTDIINKIFVDKEIRKTYLSILFSGMIGKQYEKFILANGTGRNGKGVINELFAEMLGDDYFYKANISGLCGKDFGDNGQGASPETCAMDKCRFILWDEPEDGQHINGGKMKRFTGSTIINARGMYKAEIYPVTMQATATVECNVIPAIRSRTDQSIYERVVAVPFESSFLSKEQVEKDKTGLVFEGNSYLKTNEFKRKYKFALFRYLMEWGKKNWTGNIYVAERCVQASRKYINSNDELKNWLENNYIITERRSDMMKFCDIYNDFKNYIEYDRLSVEERKRWRRKAFKESLDMTEYSIESDKNTQGNTLTYYFIEKREEVE